MGYCEGFFDNSGHYYYLYKAPSEEFGKNEWIHTGDKCNVSGGYYLNLYKMPVSTTYPVTEHVTIDLGNNNSIEYEATCNNIQDWADGYVNIANGRLYINGESSGVSFGMTAGDSCNEAFSFSIYYNEEAHTASLLQWWYDTKRATQRQTQIGLVFSAETYTAFKAIERAPKESSYYEDHNGPSGQGGGNGYWIPGEYDPQYPDLPEVTALSTGFITTYLPNLAQINQLSAFMWSHEFIDSVLKLFANPIDAIIGLHMLPFSIPPTWVKTMTVAGVPTTFQMSGTNTQFYTFTSGAYNLHEYFGSYLDYAPYTKIEIKLPFIGIKRLDPEIVYNHATVVRYMVDILTGSCVAYILCDQKVRYTFPGNCASQIPISNANYNSTISAMINLGVSAVTTVATEGATAAQLVSSGISAVTSMKPGIDKAGNLGASYALMDERRPYFIVTRPHICTPDNQAHYTGYPSFITMPLSQCSGYTIVNQIHLEGISGATQAELNEIEALLKGGVIL